MRRPIIAANWKMHMGRAEAREFARAFLPRVADLASVDVVIAPPFPLLECLQQALAGSNVELAAQNVHPAERGAYTGEVSTRMLADLGCRYVIVGHSERRALFG